LWDIDNMPSYDPLPAARRWPDAVCVAAGNGSSPHLRDLAEEAGFTFLDRRGRDAADVALLVCAAAAQGPLLLISGDHLFARLADELAATRQVIRVRPASHSTQGALRPLHRALLRSGASAGPVPLGTVGHHLSPAQRTLIRRRVGRLSVAVRQLPPAHYDPATDTVTLSL